MFPKLAVFESAHFSTKSKVTVLPLTSVQLPISKAPFTLLRFCHDAFLLQQSFMFTLLRFCTKTEGKHSFLCFHIDLPDNKYGAKDLCFCAFTFLQICEARCWILQRFQNLRFCAFTLIKCVFENLRFRGYPLLIAFSKTSVIVAFLCRFV